MELHAITNSLVPGILSVMYPGSLLMLMAMALIQQVQLQETLCKMSVFGNANGTAVGMAPHAHLAIYKVCSGNKCADSDMLAEWTLLLRRY